MKSYKECAKGIFQLSWQARNRSEAIEPPYTPEESAQVDALCQEGLQALVSEELSPDQASFVERVVTKGATGQPQDVASGSLSPEDVGEICQKLCALQGPFSKVAQGSDGGAVVLSNKATARAFDKLCKGIKWR